MLIKALDDDDSGSVGFEELADFVQRGTATFNSGPDGAAADNGIVDSWDVPADKVRAIFMVLRASRALHCAALTQQLSLRCADNNPSLCRT